MTMRQVSGSSLKLGLVAESGDFGIKAIEGDA
jgi:hypothetical protein